MQNNVLSLTKMGNDFILMTIASKTVKEKEECDFTAFIFGCFRINYHTNMVKKYRNVFSSFHPIPRCISDLVMCGGLSLSGLIH